MRDRGDDEAVVRWKEENWMETVADQRHTIISKRFVLHLVHSAHV